MTPGLLYRALTGPPEPSPKLDRVTVQFGGLLQGTHPRYLRNGPSRSSSMVRIEFHGRKGSGVMTMLYSFYSSEGLIFAADSRITRAGQTKSEPSQQKIRRVPKVGVAQGLIGYYGLAEVGRGSMSAWLSEMINRWPGSHSPEDFADYVVGGLTRDTTPQQKKVVSGLHFGAFRSIDGRVEPLFFHIRNTYDFDEQKGVHHNLGDFWHQEQFMDR